MSRKNNLLSEMEIASFCQQINMIIKAGLPTYYGISILRDNATDSLSRELYEHIYKLMEGGTSLYDALMDSDVFPEYMLQMIHIGEQTGRLEEVLDSLIVYYEREAQIHQGIRQAVTYPLIMSVMMLAVIVVIITKVVPIFADVYAKLGSGLTGSAKLLMNISTFLNEYILILVVGFVALAVLAFLYLQTAKGRRILSRSKISLSMSASRFANCMYLALASGLDSDHGLTLAESLIENPFMKEKIRRCKALILEGESFAQSLLMSGVFSSVYASLITIGYKTSAMDDIMLQISKAYEEETDEQLHRFISTLEPSLIIILSFFIGLILISFLLPLLGIMSSIG